MADIYGLGQAEYDGIEEMYEAEAEARVKVAKEAGMAIIKETGGLGDVEATQGAQADEGGRDEIYG